MKRPLIGIPGNLMLHIGGPYGCIEKNFVNKTYTDAVYENGGNPVIIPYSPNKEDYESILDVCTAFLIPGGEDVDPSLYNEGPHEKLGEIKPWHDKFILSILEHAEKNKKFCMGICKGMQLMAVYGGGKLYQDIYSQREEPTLLHCQKGRRNYLVHSVEIEKGTYLHKIMKETDTMVNSMHHQSVRQVGEGFDITAFAPDGIVEALESKDKLFLGVQWHPEELFRDHEAMQELFKELVKRAERA